VETGHSYVTKIALLVQRTASSIFRQQTATGHPLPALGISPATQPRLQTAPPPLRISYATLTTRVNPVSGFKVASVHSMPRVSPHGPNLLISTRPTQPQRQLIVPAARASSPSGNPPPAPGIKVSFCADLRRHANRQRHRTHHRPKQQPALLKSVEKSAHRSCRPAQDRNRQTLVPAPEREGCYPRRTRPRS